MNKFGPALARLADSARDGNLVRQLLPSLRVPQLPPLAFPDALALFIGTGFFSGYLRPFAASWGSIVGFIYFACLLQLPSFQAMIAVVVIVLGLTVWSGGRCEKLFGRKDPNSVVIDEIASVPFALWPMTLLAFRPWSLWVVLFVVYRIFDILKPYPARSSEMFGGGVGILLDDLVSATYMGLLFWFVIRLTGF